MLQHTGVILKEINRYENKTTLSHALAARRPEYFQLSELVSECTHFLGFQQWNDNARRW